MAEVRKRAPGAGRKSDKRWRDALRLELESIGPDGFHKLRAIARRVVTWP